MQTAINNTNEQVAQATTWLDRVLDNLKFKNETDLINWILKIKDSVKEFEDEIKGSKIKSVWVSEFKGHKYVHVKFWANQNHTKTYKNLNQ